MADSILDEYRKDPELAKLSDQELIALAHKASGIGGSIRDYARDYLGVKNNGGFVRDTAIDVGKGLVGIGQIATGTANLVSGGASGRAIRDTFGGDLEDVKHKMDGYYSDARQDSNEAVQNAQGFWGTTKALVSNPRALVGGAVEALPSMLLPGGVAGKVAERTAAGGLKVAEGMAPMARAAAAREAVEASKVAANRASSATWGGMTATQTADRVNHESNDPAAMYGAALGAGAVVGGLTHGFSFLPGGHMADQAATTAKRMGLSVANQSAMMGSMGVAQTGAENLATGKPMEHGMAEALASGIINGAGFGLMGGRKRPDVDPRVQGAQDAAARAAVGDTDFQTKWTQWAQEFEARQAERPAPPETLYTTPRGDTMGPEALQAYQQFGNNPVDIGTGAGVEAPKVLDPAARQMGEAKAKAAKPQEPEVTQDERNAILAKYGEARPNYIGGKLDQHGQPLAVGHHFDTSAVPDKNGNVKPYLSPEKLQQAIDKLAIAEREKPEAQRAAEQQLSDVMNKEIGRRPTSRELDKIAKTIDLPHAESVEALVGHIDVALAAMEGKTDLKPDAQLIKDALTAWRKHLDDKSPSHVKVAAPAAEGKPQSTEPVEVLKPMEEHAADALKEIVAQAPKPVALPTSSGTMKVVTKAEYAKKMEKWNERDKQRLRYLLGVDEEGSQIGHPLTHEQIAAIESAQTGKTVTAKAISQWARTNGITEEAINKAAMVMPETASPEHTNEIVTHAAEGTSGLHVVDSASDIHKGGLGTQDLTAAQHRQQQVADDFMSKNGGKKATEEAAPTATDIEIEQRRKAQAEQERLMFLKQAESSPNKEAAANEFRLMRVKGDARFEELNDAQRAEFITAYDLSKAAEIRGQEPFLEEIFHKIQSEVKHERSINPEGRVPGSGSDLGSHPVGPDGSKPLQPGDAQSGGEVQQPAQPAVTVKRKRTLVKPEEAKFGKDEGHVENAYTADELRTELHDFMGTDSLGRNVIIVEHPSELADLRDVTTGTSNPDAFGWTRDGKAILIASRIEKGNAKAAFLHEVGAHLGIDRMLDASTHSRLVGELHDWAHRDGVEGEIARAALERVESADTPHHQRDAETIAYVVEEAVKRGIDPTATSYKTPLDRWFRTLWASFKKAIRRVFGDTSKLTAQDMVDLAYGAARLETTGTWHGAAAKFRKFNHDFMGTGEGAQVYGWGTYSAERKGVADGYLKNDVSRKARQAERNKELYIGDKPATKDEAFDINYHGNIKGDFNSFIFSTIGNQLHDNWKGIAHAKLAEYKRIQKTEQERLARIDAAQKKYDEAKAKHEELRNRLDTFDHRIDVARKAVSKAREELSEVRREGRDFDAIDIDKKVALMERIINEGLSLRGGAKPEGLLHRLDFDIKPDEWLHYDKPMKEQSQKVLDATTQLLKDHFGVKPDVDPKWEKSQRTGKELYDYLQRKLGSDQKASELLHSYGIKGSKHYDGASRGTVQNIARAKEQIARLEKKVAQYEDFKKQYPDDPHTQESYERYVELLKDTREDLTKLESEQGDLTHNRVAFRDRDIQRVMGYKGGKVEQVHFGKNAVAARNETIDRLPAQLRKPVRGVMATIHDVTVKGAQMGAFMHDLADWGSKHGLPAMKKIADVMAVKGAYKVEKDQALGRVIEQFQKLKAEEQDKVQQFLKDSTFEQRWGYQPSWRKEVTVHPEAEKQYKALSPEAQKVADEVFRHNYEVRQEKQKALEDIIHAHYTEMASRADGEEVAALWQKMESELKSAQRTEMEGPYVPLKRFGSQVVAVKSKALLEAKETDGKKYREMLDDPEHYRVEHHDSIYAAENRRAELAQQLGDSHVVERSEKERHEYLGAGYETLQRLSEQMKSQFDGAEYSDADKKLAHATYRAINEAIIQSLGEHNARTSTLQRKYIAGVDSKDMMRGFATQGYADNGFLAAMKHNKELQDHTSALRAQVHDGKGDRTMKQQFYNELQARRAANMGADTPRWVGHAMRFTTLWKLITSPAYYLQYLSQPLTMFLPLVNGDHGYGAGNSAFAKAVKDTASISKGLMDTDLSKIKDAGERKMLETLRAMGTIAIGHEQQFGQLQMLPEKGFSKVWQTATQKITQIPHSVEMHNRIASALAAYRLEMAKHGDAERATQYAKNKVYEAYGDYSTYNAPRIMQGGGVTKLVMQYRQFQLIHTALLTRLLNNAFAGASPEERRAAKLQLAYMAGHYGVLAGALGVPAAHAVAGAVKAVFGDDNDVDIETFVNRHTGNKFMADMILGGVPRAVFGQDLSARMGAGDILSPFRYADMGNALTSKRDYKDFTLAAMGPFIGGMVPQVVDGVDMIGKGDYYRGMEQLMPKGIGDIMKAYRFADEGVTDKKGQTIVNKDDVSTGTVLAQALGSRPTQVSEPQHDAIVVGKIMQKFKDEANTLKSQFIRARKEGEDTEAIVEKWQKMQEKQRAAGVKAAPLSELYKSMATARKRDNMVIDGVPFRKTNRALVQDITGDE